MFGREVEETRYFVSRKSKLLGPYPIGELKARLRAGTVQATDTAWTQGMLKWLPVSEILGGSPGASGTTTPTRTVATPPPVQKRSGERKSAIERYVERESRQRTTPQDLLRQHRGQTRPARQVQAMPGGAAYASFRQRVIAYGLDALVIYMLVAMLASELLPQIEAGLDHRVVINETALYGPIAILVGWLYYALLESSRLQATFGKRWMRLRVADLNGQRIEFRRASLRYWGQYLSGALGGLGFLIAAFTPRRQALHDMIAGCVVLRGSARHPAVA